MMELKALINRHALKMQAVEPLGLRFSRVVGVREEVSGNNIMGEGLMDNCSEFEVAMMEVG